MSKKDKASKDTTQILNEIISSEISKAKGIYEAKKKKETEEFHNKIIDWIQESGLHPTSVIFVLEMIKAEIMQQFLIKTIDNNEVNKDV